MVSTSAAESFHRSCISQEGQMISDSAKQNSTIEADVLSPSASRTNDKATDAATETSPLGNTGPDCNNMSSVSTSVSGLYPEGNGKANQDPEFGSDGKKPFDEASRSSNDDDQSKKPVELPNLEEPQVQSVPCDSSEESDVMEQDVKVCDICGDAGREDLLATCSRCSDGAEHTYCMRQMLQKVPDGEWLCEECKFAEEGENQKPGLQEEAKRSSKGSLSSQVLGKRTGEGIEIDSSKKKQVLDRTVESPRGSNGVSASSRDSLLKNVNKGKSGMTSKISSVHEISHSPHSPKISRPQVSKSTLLKSKSFSAFSMKPKAKQVAEGFPQKQRGHPSSDSRALGKSASFRYANRELPNALDSKTKMGSSKFSHVPDGKEPTSNNEQNNKFDKNRLPRLDLDRPSSARSNTTHCVPKLDQKHTPRGEVSSLSSVSDHRDSNVESSSQVASSTARRSAEIAGSGPSSSDNAYIRKKSSLISPRNGTGAGLSMPCNSGTRNTQAGLPRPRESRNHFEKSQDNSVSRVGQTAESRSHNSEVDAPAARRREMNFGNKSTAAVTTSMLKRPGIRGRNKPPDKSENSSTPVGGSSQERSTFFDASKKPANGTCEGQGFPKCGVSYSGKHIPGENGTQLNGLLNGFANPRKVENPEAADLIQGKPVLRELPILPSELLSSIRKISIIPEHACIWHGGFKVQRGGEMLDLHGGFQAHLPTNASPKVVEMVSKFADKIALTEVPRVSTWPVQFQDSGTKEANIALYFFARDLESYQQSYKGLLENLMKGDLALKGNLGDIELLVFPSSQLPEKSQRWNMSFYLWGVFRGRKANGVDHHEPSDGECSKKKQKTQTKDKTEHSNTRQSSLSADDVGSRIHEHICKESIKVDMEDSLSAERCLFPFGSLPSNTNNATRSHGPDLELALGADAKLPNKGLLPFSWMGIMDKEDDQVKAGGVNGKEEEGSLASLSLSLSFPFPDEDRNVKPLPKEKLRQEGTL